MALFTGSSIGIRNGTVTLQAMLVSRHHVAQGRKPPGTVFPTLVAAIGIEWVCCHIGIGVGVPAILEGRGRDRHASGYLAELLLKNRRVFTPIQDLI